MAESNAPEGGARGFFRRVRDKLSQGKSALADSLTNLLPGRRIDADVLEELETQLITADVGGDATQSIVGRLQQRVARRELGDAAALKEALANEMIDILQTVEQPLAIRPEHKPFVILVVGINGAGKTTTIGKLAHRLCGEGKSVLLAAGDTFRAAAIEQLEIWAQRNSVPMVSQQTGADPASVVFDAVQAAKARRIDVMIADTAGRLHTQGHLMNELKKVRRVLQKVDPTAPHEVLLILDGTIGQNALAQAAQFHAAVGVTGLVVTKLDGTAKGGVVLAIAQKLKIPIRFIGVGEQLEDFGVFDARQFVGALLRTTTEAA